MKKSEKALWIIGIFLALVAALLMFNGNLLGEDTTGIARVLGIVAIGFIASESKGIRKKTKET